jgi:hypothetical protein
MNNFRKFVLSGLETLAPLGFLLTVIYVAFEMSSWGVLGFLLGLVVGVIVATILFGVIYTLIDISNSLKGQSNKIS